MKINENIKIVGEKVILIPYEQKHVSKYHNWMKSIELQSLTSSQPLTLDEEYEMQKCWRNDEDKCTFIILLKSLFETTNDEIHSMVGDTNIFLRTDDETARIGECEIMIAEENCRGRGIGWEAILLMLKFGQSKLKVDKFEAKINIENIQSLNMFGKIHFKETARSAIFNEITMERPITMDWIHWLDEKVKLDVQYYC